MFPHVVKQIAREWDDGAWIMIKAPAHTNDPLKMYTYVLGYEESLQEHEARVRAFLNNDQIRAVTRDFWNNDHVQDDDARVWCNVLCYKDLQDKDSVLYRRLAKTQTDRDIEAWAWVTRRCVEQSKMPWYRTPQHGRVS